MFFFLFSTFCFKFFFQKEKVKKIYEKKNEKSTKHSKILFSTFFEKKRRRENFKFQFYLYGLFQKTIHTNKIEKIKIRFIYINHFFCFFLSFKKKKDKKAKKEK